MQQDTDHLFVSSDQTVAGILHEMTRHLSQAGIENARREARLLMEYGSGLSLTTQLTRGGDLLSADVVSRLSGLTGRRMQHEPLHYITGQRGFWSLDVAVSPATLIPRADTEALIESLCALRPDRSRVSSVLDLGTGTGCLLLAALGEYPEAIGVGVDRSEAAARLARENAHRNGMQNRCFMLTGDWNASISGRFDVILSNPPYIRSQDINQLMPEVARFEPMSALDGGQDGLTEYRRIIPSLPSLMADNGLAVIEAGAGQGDDIVHLAECAGLQVLEIRSDLGGISRALAFGKRD